MHQRYSLFTLVSMILLAMAMASCSSKKSGAVSVVEAYIQALSDKNTTQISSLSCADWEQSALVEVDSLTSVGSKVDKLQCKESGTDGSDTLVSCTGALVLDYNGEAQQLDLSKRTYVTRQEGGEWRMCGYK